MKFFPNMQEIYNRLSELAKTEIKTEAERIEEAALASTFWDMRRLNDFLQRVPGFADNGSMEESHESELKARIIHLAHFQAV